VTSDLRSRLKKAAAQLKADGHPELASSVETVLAPGGWTKLRASAGAGSASEAGKTVPFPIYMPEVLRAALKKAADDKDVASLGTLVSDGFRAAAEGRWTPPEEAWTPPAGQARVNLNVRVDAAARAALEAALPRLVESTGRRLSVTSVAIDWLLEELGVEDQLADPEGPAE